MSFRLSLVLGICFLLSSSICFAETQTSPVLVRLTVVEPSIPSPPSPRPPYPSSSSSSSSRSSEATSENPESSSSSLSSSSTSLSSSASSLSFSSQESSVPSSFSSSSLPDILKPSAPPPPPVRTFVQEGPSQPILCLGPVPLCEDSSPTKVDDLSCALPTFECSVLSLTCIEETIQKDAFVCGKSLLSSEQFPSLTTLQTTHQVELLSWSLWAIVLLFLFLRFERWLYHRSFGYAPVSVAEYSVALAFASNQRGLRIRHILHSLLLALTVTAILLAIFSYYEGTKAEHLDVDVTIAERTLALSCTTPVDLGTFIGNGDSGTQSDDHSTLCTVFTTNTSGYALKWQMISPSSGSGTGSLLSASGDAIPSLLSSTPVTWPAFGSGVTEQWGARLASKSTTVDTSVWGIDGASELWSRVGTGSTTIALRNDATSIGGDQQTIGFRAAIDSSINKPAGTYSASILFSAVAP